jgi:hypothetical protein
MVTHRLLASMAQRDRGEDRPDMLAVLRPLPPDPRGQDDDIQSHEEPIEERHRLQPSKRRRESMSRFRKVWEGQVLDGWRKL